MNNKSKIIVGSIVLLAVLAIIAKLFLFSASDTSSDEQETTDNLADTLSTALTSESVNDTVYVWDDYLLEWVPTNETLSSLAEKPKGPPSTLDLTEPIDIRWPFLMNIQYRLKYFSEIDMEIFAPIFNDELKSLHGKEAIIKGYVLPFEEEGILALSYNSFASCFFCGKASPASIISLYPAKKKRYKIDDLVKFKGKLFLNEDNPDEFYYILRDAVEI